MTSVSLTAADVAKVAELSRLKLTEAELSQMTVQLGRVLEYVAVLNELDTGNVEPMAHAVDLTNVLRDDFSGESLSREEALANAPKTDGECFLVPQILDGA